MKSQRVVVIIQARMGSTRFPGKVLLDLGGKSVLERVLARARQIPGVAEVIVAIPKGSSDDALAKACVRLDVKTFRGREQDVLDRFYQAARLAKADIIVRVTADCPLLDPVVAGRVIRAVAEGRADYASNTAPPTYPDGLDAEAMTMEALGKAWKEAKLRIEREHVTPYLRSRPERFRQANIASPCDLSRQRWTLDDALDLDFLRAVFAKLGPGADRAGYEEVVALLKRDPTLQRRAEPARNEGYYMSLLKENPIPARQLALKRSLTHLKRVKKLIPGCSQTFSKAPNQFVRGIAPLFLRRGKGCRVWDLDGNEFIDTMMALAPVSLGYGDPDVNAAVAKQLKEGTILSQPHPLELEVAQEIVKLVPCAQMVRFAKSGSDATSGAVRAARAFTGRDLIVAGGYHGWHDWFIATTTRRRGIPEAVGRLTKTFRYNDLESLHRVFKRHPGQVAAVILEPIGIEEPKNGFLQELAAMTRKNGALLIFDEVVTGFRFALGGAQEHFGVIPDLAAFGKALGNGFPLSAVAGRADIMKIFDEIFFSFTFGGELLSLAAAKAVLAKLRAKPVIERIWEQGRRLQDGYNTLARAVGLAEFTRCEGLAPHTVATFRKPGGEDWRELKSLMQQECVRRGLLFTGAHNPSWAHTETEVDRILWIYASALPIAAQAVRDKAVKRRLEGPCVEPVFRKP